jgi:hypothetical protein
LPLVCLVATPAAAEPPITSRDYSIDFYEGTAIGDARMVAMGGAGLALIIGSAGTLLNASAPAVRKTTDNDRWSWDWHIDYLNGRLSTDFDNNGEVIENGSQLATLGLSFRYREWAAAIVGTVQTAPISETNDDLDAQNLRVRFSIARWFERFDMSIGIGVQTIAFRLLDVDDMGREVEMFSIGGGGVIAGATWVPRMQDFRIAAAVESPIIGGNVSAENCDPTACQLETGGPMYILPNQVESSTKIGVGGAFRFSETYWNQQVKPKFRDERSLTLSSDVWITGRSQKGFGIEKFVMQEKQRSGRHTSVGVRVGAEVEAIPGRLRLRAGTYYEPERFDDVGGRVHATFGIEGRVFEFKLWGLRRGRIGVLTDFASRYRNIGLSIGFWQ